MFELLDCVLCEDYKTDNIILKKGTWNKFKKDVKHTPLYLFGTGRACKVFLKRYKNKFSVHGVFDNSPTKWGTKFEGYEVMNPAQITEGAEKLILITTTSYMDDIATQLNEMNFQNYYGLAVLESKRVLIRMATALAKMFYWKMLPVKRNRILFTNGFKKYSDSAKAIIDELIAQKVDCEILWMNPDPACEYPKEVTLVKNDVFDKIIAHATSKIWVDNYKKELWIKKKKNQKYINTWHGCVSLKKLDFDQQGVSERHLQRTVYDSGLIDLRISNSKFCTDMYRRAMKYEGDVLECGTPRLDQCFCKDAVPKVREKLGISKEAKIVLYAPTWRMATKSGFQGVNNIVLNFEKLRETFKEKLGDEVYILIKLHPSAKRIAISGNEFIKDVTTWDDVYELLIESDVLISDYSSLVFEMGFMNKQVFLFVDDYRQYKEEHGVYMELDEMPYPYAFTQAELEVKIQKFEEEKYKKDLKYFNEVVLEVKENGTATKQVVKKIRQYMKL